MANPRPSSPFQKNHDACYLPRRRISEKLVYSRLRDYGDKMFDVLATEAASADTSDARIKAADRFLSHTLLQPKQSEGIGVFSELKTSTIQDLSVSMDWVIKKLGKGEISLGHAEKITGLLEKKRDFIRLEVIEKTLDDVREKLGIK